jgi:predicted deacylase
VAGDRRNVDAILSEWGDEPPRSDALTEEITLTAEPLGKRADGSDVLSYSTTLGDASRGQVLVCIALHGDEPCGIGAWWGVAQEIERNPSLLQCAVRVVIPDPGRGQRNLDGHDPNRIFTEARQTTIQRLARSLYDEMNQSRFVIDVHCGMHCAPFVIVDDKNQSGPDLQDAASWKAAEAVGCATVVEMNGLAGASLQSALTAAARRRGIAGFTIELPHRATPELATNVLRNALVGAGVLSGGTVSLGLNDAPRGHGYRRATLRSNAAGYYYPVASLDQWDDPNHPVCEIRKITGEFESAVCYSRAYVLALDKHLGEAVVDGEVIGEVAVPMNNEGDQ